MIVKFATLCDIDDCNARSEEYTQWPSCTECNLDFCPKHGEITIEADYNQPEQGICTDCKE